MDILSHGLWAGAAGKAVNLIRQPAEKTPLKLKLVAFFGVFPDLFAFVPAFIYMFASYILPSIPKMYHPRPGQVEPAVGDSMFISNLTHNLYNLSHSLFVFLVVFALLYLIFKKPAWVMIGWIIHILMDIPSHSYDFYPTPFLWPVSDFKVDGFSWGTPLFMITNYSLLFVTYLILFYIKKTKIKLS